MCHQKENSKWINACTAFLWFPSQWLCISYLNHPIDAKLHCGFVFPLLCNFCLYPIDHCVWMHPKQTSPEVQSDVKSDVNKTLTLRLTPSRRRRLLQTKQTLGAGQSRSKSTTWSEIRHFQRRGIFMTHRLGGQYWKEGLRLCRVVP